MIDYDETESSEDDEDGECDWCAEAEEALVDQARKYKTNGWDPEEEGSGYRYGSTLFCHSCGRAFDFDAVDDAYAEAPGLPETPTGSQTDEVRRLAGSLGLDRDSVEKLFEVFSRRPMA